MVELAINIVAFGVIAYAALVAVSLLFVIAAWMTM
jgi:hypothetical protein